MPTFIRAGMHLINLENVAYIVHVPANHPSSVPKEEHLIVNFTGGQNLSIGDPDAVRALRQALTVDTASV